MGFFFTFNNHIKTIFLSKNQAINLILSCVFLSGEDVQHN